MGDPAGGRPLTPSELAELWVECALQGIPLHLEDPAIVERVAEILRDDSVGQS